MRVKLLTIYSGPSGVFAPGEIANLHEDAALDLIDKGFARIVKDEPKVVEQAEIETAMIEPGEKEVKKRGRGRRVK